MQRPGNIFRGGLQFAGGKAPSPPPLVYGLDTYSTLVAIGIAAPAGVRGSAAGFWIRLLWWITSVTGASATRVQISAFAGAGTGFRVFSTGTNASFVPSGFFTGAVSVGPPTFSLTPARIGLLMDHWMVWDQPAGRMRGYFQGAEYGNTPTGLAFLPNMTQAFTQGCRDNITTPATDCAIVGIAGGDGFVPSPAEVAAAYAASVANAAAGLPLLSAVPGKTTWMGQVGSTWNPPVTITDTIGGQNLAITFGSAASLTLLSIPAVWAT